MAILDLFMYHREHSDKYKNGCVKVFYINDYFASPSKKIGYRGLKNMFEAGLIVGFECSANRYKLCNNKIEVIK